MNHLSWLDKYSLNGQPVAKRLYYLLLGPSFDGPYCYREAWIDYHMEAAEYEAEQYRLSKLEEDHYELV